MKIVIADIPEEGLSVDLRERLSPEKGISASEVVSTLDIQKTGAEVIVTGKVEAEVNLDCSRCLQPFSRRVEIPVNVVYHSDEEVAEERHGSTHALNTDEMDMGFYHDGEIDLLELLTEQLVLNSQMKPLCDEACKGICPHCGTDLNTSACSCGGKEIDPRLEVLKKYFEKRKE